ncbi:hypothetical protein BGW38_001267 [Lunasporangiospora selenospora]|uniref:Uncharacterized protein n=1 Tax=Lunasporangiospora selenospora TaxID=979761 RepID=A0A9P6FU54_9FUNG|nr:hypothetical protein BGW38_001267 [Lunasporangiospora selenospora]
MSSLRPALRPLLSTYRLSAARAASAVLRTASAPLPRAAWSPARVSSALFSTSARRLDPSLTTPVPNPVVPEEANRTDTHAEEETKHAVVSTFDLFSIGIGPSSR